jgi:hypothetical protein
MFAVALVAKKRRPRMNTYKIDVNLVDAAESATGKVFQVNPLQMQVKLGPDGSFKNARVTWTFRNLPAGLTPVITFDSPEMISAGPTTTLGATPQVTLEIRFPLTEKAYVRTYSAKYRISTPGSAGKAVMDPVLEVPSLVVVRSPDPPTTTPPPNDYPPVSAASDADL